uniref:Uncharacterized protein n=1 Tax=Arundo donax TaxID=35708 RepID=A0A0A8YKF9_ARUDO
MFASVGEATRKGSKHSQIDLL